MSPDLLAFLGALIPTFLLSRVFLWLMRKWDGGLSRLLIAHGLSLAISAFLAAMAMADGGAMAGLQALIAYAQPQGVWLVFDLVMARRRRRAVASEPAE
ncbi:hypothetical protein [Geminicoccus harenae]|uniref:hypothetical protein n=1 Tax=Geminicoccus harenae TaxID=2498453 RepID=UPI00168B8019|nr:hypothetical protein [Geminicoccus harenae]